MNTTANHESISPLSCIVLGKEELLFSILDYCDETSRINCIYLSKAQVQILTSNISYKWRLEKLHLENGIYYNRQIQSNNWKSVFVKHWTRRGLWEKSDDESSSSISQYSDLFRINVCARFKPTTTSVDDSTKSFEESKKKTVLPFHQRLALIKMNHNLQSNKDALEVLKRQGGWFGNHKSTKQEEDDNRQDSTTKEEEDKEEGERNEKSLSSSSSLTCGVRLIDDKTNSVILVDRIQGIRGFKFNHVLEETASQARAYETSTMPLITEFINGFNATCIVYGQTGSGKTHTMFGNCDEPFLCSNSNAKDWGIVPRACLELFQALDYRRVHLHKHMEASVSVSYVEIYGNDVTDLLRNGTSCGHNKAATQRYVLDGSAEIPLSNFDEAVQCLNKGERQKKKAATLMNERSSRAHSLFILTLRQKCVDSGVEATSRLFLADLGGSEQLKKSQPFSSSSITTEEESNKINKRYEEAIHINLGLFALKKCVQALRRKSSYIPYSDSKLTLLLSPGLCGDTQTSFIVCGSQEERHVAETISAMKFGQMCRGVSNTVENNANAVQDLLQTINDGIEECQEDIRNNERWETKEEMYNGQVRQTTVIVGAEDSRRRLAELLRQKMELTGEVVDNVYAADASHVQSFGAHMYQEESDAEVRDQVEK